MRLRWYKIISWGLTEVIEINKKQEIKECAAGFWGLWVFRGDYKEGVWVVWRSKSMICDLKKKS